MFRLFRHTIEIGVDELDVLLAEGARVLDVREDWEFRRGHVPGAIHVPLGRLGAHASQLPRDARLLVICESGNRSRGAADFLLGRGFEGTASVRGGTSAWARSGRRLEAGSQRVA